MVQSQARLSLSKRNWSKNTSKYSIPISQFCVLVLILQIGSIAYISVRGTQKSVRVGRKLFDLRRTPPLRSKVLTGPDPFLPKNVKLASLENHIHAESHKKVKACRWYQRNVHGKVRVVHEDGCERPNQKFIVYNPLNHDRFICNGTVVVQAEGFTLVSNKDCDDGMTKSRLFGITPTLENAKKMPPITIGNVGAEDSPDVEDFPCDVGCRKHAATEENVNELSILGTPWTVQYSMESAAHYPQLKFDTTAHRYNLFYATTSFDSEIPLPYFSWAEYSIQTPPVEFEKGIKGASFVASNCHSLSNRELVVEELMKLMRVDALGSCLQNALPPPGAVLNDSASLKRQYLFHLAFENSIEHDCEWRPRFVANTWPENSNSLFSFNLARQTLQKSYGTLSGLVRSPSTWELQTFGIMHHQNQSFHGTTLALPKSWQTTSQFWPTIERCTSLIMPGVRNPYRPSFAKSTSLRMFTPHVASADGPTPESTVIRLIM